MSGAIIPDPLQIPFRVTVASPILAVRLASLPEWAQRLAAEGIGVFEIRPGIVRTDMIAAVEQIYEDKIAGGLLPQRRMVEGSDVARAVRAIADGLLDYSTGQVINVDGGFHLRRL